MKKRNRRPAVCKHNQILTITAALCRDSGHCWPVDLKELQPLLDCLADRVTRGPAISSAAIRRSLDLEAAFRHCVPNGDVAGVFESRRRELYRLAFRYLDPAIARRKVRRSVRRRFQKALKGRRSGATMRWLTGASLEELRRHVASQFQPGMSWENYGFDTWHLDHRIPCARFDLSDPAQQQKCFHYTNLQPMWAAENLAKGAS